ncbi:hypothetical protein Salat_1827900 [Sesamum alatum]|uniref:NADH dehydrogenase subunit 6 n=1 Tax=Sesamum alatum TaxID=300844 RepID=A0AAE1Y2I4_9LAMI|nr:hypothetical protein Salat_1827900 [Sesamum alatum]
MAKGPSPLIPLLLVVALGLLLRGSSFPTNLGLPAITEAESVVFTCFFCIPFLVILAIYSTTHTIVLPLALVLVTYTVSTMLLGPLVLILLVYLAGACLPSFRGNGEDLGWGCLLIVVFVLLQWGFSEEGRQSGALVVAIVIFFYYYFSC